MSLSKGHTALLAGFIGNVVEWYDFALYGYMAGILSGLFFPGQDSTAALIATYGVFAAGFLMRPIGSAVFGWLGDTIGRSQTMLISVIMMAMPTILLGCLPTYDSIGIWAAVLLVLIRLVQGLSVGGEFSSSVTYMVETADRIILRMRLPESEHFQKHHDERCQTSPLLQAFTTNRREMIQAILFASAYGAIFYIPVVYMPEWLHSQAGMARDLALQINTAATAFLLLLIPVAGWASDHLLRRTHCIAGAMLFLALIAVPLFIWCTDMSFWSAVIAQFSFAALIAVPLGTAPAMFVELFPASDRLSGYSVAYNLGLGVIGGATPMFATWLIEMTGLSIAPAVWLTVVALIAVAAVLWIKDRSREPLPEEQGG
ncbi:MAG: MFS transporter [Desulfuromonadales bacterium]